MALASARSVLSATALLWASLVPWTAPALAVEDILIPRPGDRRPTNPTREEENLWRGETEADRLFREANKARFDLDAEKARSLFEQAINAKGSMRAKVKSRLYLKCYLPKYKVTPECEKLYKAADKLVQEDKLGEGLAAFQAMREKYPNLEWVEIGLASIHLKREDPERAATCARRALAINPDYVDAWLLLTHECLMHHDMEGAQMTAQRAHELDPYSDIINKIINQITNEMSKRKPD
ncbi:MAG: tetratricopeptide repeat protein [Cyanobacteria bacterium SZAS LIN-2]|nr:tetratricopeptide repeat protein [Cyanobacteria bacterium SZAS LIN-3]MBS1996937.1 tetratricopeptide repeat protein [Cyanobacteria bacterium SZAS LIN-2]